MKGVYIYAYTYIYIYVYAIFLIYTHTCAHVFTPRRDGGRGPGSGRNCGGHDPEITLRQDKSFFKISGRRNLPVPLCRFLTWILFGPNGGVI